MTRPPEPAAPSTAPALDPPRWAGRKQPVAAALATRPTTRVRSARVEAGELVVGELEGGGRR